MKPKNSARSTAGSTPSCPLDADHRREHDQPAEQVVQQELHGRFRRRGGGDIGPGSPSSEAADQEVHRDEHGFEEHVEQQHVEGDQGDQHHRLDGQHQRDVGVGGALARAGVVPAGDQQQRHQHRGQQHQHQRDAVQTQGVAGAESRYPPMGFDELIVRSAGAEADR
jgi:hypothetical protein